MNKLAIIGLMTAACYTPSSMPAPDEQSSHSSTTSAGSGHVPGPDVHGEGGDAADGSGGTGGSSVGAPNTGTGGSVDPSVCAQGLQPSVETDWTTSINDAAGSLLSCTQYSNANPLVVCLGPWPWGSNTVTIEPGFTCQTSSVIARCAWTSTLITNNHADALKFYYADAGYNVANARADCNVLQGVFYTP